MTQISHTAKYQMLDQLPSRYIPYPPRTLFSHRELLWEEILFIAENSAGAGGLASNELQVIDFLLKGDLIRVERGSWGNRPVDVWDITLHDWEFIFLQAVTNSFANLEYPFNGHCPKCRTEVKTLQVSVAGGKTITAKTGGEPNPTKGMVKAAEIQFKTIDDDVEMPIELILDVGLCNLEFNRLYNHKQGLMDPDGMKKFKYHLTGKKWLDRIGGQVSKEPVDNRALTTRDLEIVSYVLEKIDHDAKSEVQMTCERCGHVYAVPIAWEAMDFVPFRRDEQSLQDRVAFGGKRNPKPAPSSLPASNQSHGREERDYGREEQKLRGYDENLASEYVEDGSFLPPRTYETGVEAEVAIPVPRSPFDAPDRAPGTEAAVLAEAPVREVTAVRPDVSPVIVDENKFSAPPRQGENPPPAPSDESRETPLFDPRADAAGEERGTPRISEVEVRKVDTLPPQTSGPYDPNFDVNYIASGIEGTVEEQVEYVQTQLDLNYERLAHLPAEKQAKLIQAIEKSQAAKREATPGNERVNQAVNRAMEARKAALGASLESLEQATDPNSGPTSAFAPKKGNE